MRRQANGTINVWVSRSEMEAAGLSIDVYVDGSLYFLDHWQYRKIASLLQSQVYKQEDTIAAQADTMAAQAAAIVRVTKELGDEIARLRSQLGGIEVDEC